MAVRSILAELKRRNVLRAATLYAAIAWLLVQVITQVGPIFDLPSSTQRWAIVALAIGFPFAMVLSWLYELTPEGFRREGDVEIPSSVRYSTGRKLDFWIIGVLCVAVVLLVTNQVVLRRDVTSRTNVADSKSIAAALANVPAKSIAVLPFQNLNVDKQDAYFVAGIRDLILTKLADIGDLKVIARTSTAQYASHPNDLKPIGRQLGVATILEGTVQKVGNQVLINVQLIDAHSESHIWAQSYQRTLDNVFGVEGEVAEKVAMALKAKLSPAESQRLARGLSPDPVANDLFLRAEHFTNQGLIGYDTASFKQAIPLYRQAIAKAPDFALARARLSYAESQLAWFGGGGESVQELRADARTQAEHAMALQPDLPESHLAVGFSDYWGRGDFEAALTAFEAAIEARPNAANALAARAYVLRRQGHFDDAIATFQQALARDPRNTALTFELGMTYMLVKHYVDAEASLKRALALDPQNINAKLYDSKVILFAHGDIVRSLAAAQGDDPQLKQRRVDLLTLQRMYRAALEQVADIPDTPDNFNFINGSKALVQANLYRLAGDATHARSLFEQALPLAQAQLKAQAGSTIKESIVWSSVANAELGLGETALGLAAIDKSETLRVRSGDHFFGPVIMEFNAGLYAQARRPDLAVPLLEKALATPGIGVNYSPVLLWLDPVWDPIRRDPGFEALLKNYAKDRPAPTAAASASTNARAAAGSPAA